MLADAFRERNGNPVATQENGFEFVIGVGFIKAVDEKFHAGGDGIPQDVFGTVHELADFIGFANVFCNVELAACNQCAEKVVNGKVEAVRRKSENCRMLVYAHALIDVDDGVHHCCVRNKHSLRDACASGSVNDVSGRVKVWIRCKISAFAGWRFYKFLRFYQQLAIGILDNVILSIFGPFGVNRNVCRAKSHRG